VGFASWISIAETGESDSFNQGRLKWNADVTELATRSEDLYTLIYPTTVSDGRFKFGTTGAYSLRHGSSTDAFIVNAETTKTADNLFKVENNGLERFAVGFDGVLKLTTLVSAATPTVGGLYFSGTDLYLGR
jgi:hypothetical protein